MRVSRPIPDMLFTQPEQDIWDNYVKAYKKEYSGLTTSDTIQLDTAATWHIIGIRYANKELSQGTYNFNSRYNPVSIEHQILDSLALTRKARIASKIPVSDSAESELRDLLMSMGEESHNGSTVQKA